MIEVVFLYEKEPYSICFFTSVHNKNIIYTRGIGFRHNNIVRIYRCFCFN